MKPIFPKLAVVVFLCISSLIGWRFGRHGGFEDGYEKGAKDGLLAGEIRGCLNPIQTILTGQAIAEKGSPEKGEQFVITSLYYNAYFLESNRNAPLISKNETELFDSLVSKVGEYYWKHPSTLNLDIKAPNWQPGNPSSSKSATLAKRFNEAPVKMREMLMRFKPMSGEAVDGKPSKAIQPPK
jgi:hypothetical protein